MPKSLPMLDPRHAMLLVIDVQERINGAMADQSHMSRLTVLVEACGVLGVPILATEQYPKGLGPTVEVLAKRLPTPRLVKDTFSCVRQPEVMEAIDHMARRQVLVTGIEAHVCVLQTVLDLLHRGRQVHVVYDAVNSRRVQDRDWALHRMAGAGAVITATESALFEMLERCGTDEFRGISKMIKDIPV